jgi:hypothetical protein
MFPPLNGKGQDARISLGILSLFIQMMV